MRCLSNRFAASESKFKEVWEARIRELTSKERIALWGAGAKGAMFTNLLDLEACVVNLTPQEQGHYVPRESLLLPQFRGQLAGK